MGDSDLNQSCDSATILRAQTPVQIGSILVKIVEKVLATLTIKYHQSRLRGLNRMV